MRIIGGSEGAELVAFHLNNYFGPLIDTVNSHGGDLYKVLFLL